MEITWLWRLKIAMEQHIHALSNIAGDVRRLALCSCTTWCDFDLDFEKAMACEKAIYCLVDIQ